MERLIVAVLIVLSLAFVSVSLVVGQDLKHDRLEQSSE